MRSSCTQPASECCSGYSSVSEDVRYASSVLSTALAFSTLHTQARTALNSAAAGRGNQSLHVLVQCRSDKPPSRRGRASSPVIRLLQVLVMALLLMALLLMA